MSGMGHSLELVHRLDVWLCIWTQYLLDLFKNLLLHVRVDCEVVHHPGQKATRGVKPADHHRDGVGREELLVVPILLEARKVRGTDRLLKDHGFRKESDIETAAYYDSLSRPFVSAFVLCHFSQIKFSVISLIPWSRIVSRKGADS